MGKLHEPEVLKAEIGIMLRSGKSRQFVGSFVTQWLGTRALGREFIPDPKVFPKYTTDADLALQPDAVSRVDRCVARCR